MFKRSKKQSQVTIDEKKGHLFLGGKEDLRLLMLRPIDIIEFAEFAGANSDDIVIWCGKTIGKYFTEKAFPDEDWTGVDLSTKKSAFNFVLETLESLGYGILKSSFKKDSIIVATEEALSSEEKENIMAKNICLLYQGLLNGILEQLDVDADSEEISCSLLGDEHCIFKFELLIDEFDDADIDPDADQTGISGFLGKL